jgi:nitroreductase
MNIMEAIKSRRSIGKVKDIKVPRELIEKIIEAAVWAPNRYLTHPWRFFVLEGEGREKLAKALVDIAREEGLDENNEAERQKLNKEAEKPFRAPVIIVVAAEVTENNKVIRLEELGAVYAGIQNMLLAAQDLGLATYWRTGTSCYHPIMKKSFGLQEKDEVLGFIYVGYADMEKKDASRKTFQSMTKWIDSI